MQIRNGLQDAATLAASLIPSGASAIVAGTQVNVDIEEGLRLRNCRARMITFGDMTEAFGGAERKVAVGNVVSMGSPAVLDQTADFVLLLDVDHAEHPPALIRAAASRLTDEGTLLLTAANPHYAVTRARLMRGEFEELGVDGKLLLYDLDAWETVLRAADLDVADRLRVRHNPDDVRRSLGDDPDGVAKAAMTGDESTTHSFVLCARRTNGDRSSSAPAGGSLHERLQFALEAAEQRAALALSELADARARIVELSEALTERVAELEASQEQRRHVELDNVVKDAFIAELRSHVELMEAPHADPVQLENAQLRSDNEYLRAQNAQLDMTRYHVADSLHAAIRRLPPLHHALRDIARAYRTRRARRPRG